MVSDHACLVDMCCIVLELCRHPHALQDILQLIYGRDTEQALQKETLALDCLQGQRPACDSEIARTAETGCEVIIILAVIIGPPVKSIGII